MMKHHMHLFVLMLFICVQPATDAFAGRGGPEAAGDLLVHAGEIELKKGNIDGAIHEFSLALMAEPSNEKATRYLKELGYGESVYTSQSAYMPQRSAAMSRREIIEAHMNKIESQHYDAQMQMAKAKPEDCVDYYSGIDQRAGIVTLCDGMKRFEKNAWQSNDSFVRHLFEEEDSSGVIREGDKGSSSIFRKSSLLQEEEINHPQIAHLEKSVLEKNKILPVSEEKTGADSELMAKLRSSYHLEQQYDYEEFLRNQYFISQKEVLNRSDLLDEQHMYLVKLHWELEEARNQIQHLLAQQEELLNHTTFEVYQMRENGRIE